MPRYRPKARIIRTFLLVPPSSFFRPRSAMPAPYGESERCVMLEAATWNGKWRKSWFFVAPSYFFGKGRSRWRKRGRSGIYGTVCFLGLLFLGVSAIAAAGYRFPVPAPEMDNNLSASLRPRTCKPHYRTGREGSWEDGSRRVNTVPDIGA